jgi:hypothetical protein
LIASFILISRGAACLEPDQHGGGRRLLASAARAADAAFAKTQLGHFALDIESLLVRGAQCGGHAVHRQLHFVTLQPFLQFGLRILGRGFHARVDFHRLVQPVHQRLGGGKAGVEVDRADQRLERIGQDRRPVRAAGAGLALAQLEQRRQRQPHSQAVQGVLLDQVGPHARQVALGQGRQADVQQVRNRQVQHRVAEKLQALVVVGRKAAVRERELEQPRVGEGVLETRLQRDEAAVHLFERRVQRDSPLYLRVR